VSHQEVSSVGEIGAAIARVPEAYADRCECSIETDSMTVEGQISTVDVAEEPGENATVTVEDDGTEYRLEARPYSGDGVDSWTAAPVQTGAGVDLGPIQALEIEPPEMLEAEESDGEDEFEVIAAMQDAESELGGMHAGSSTTKSLADRRAARDNRADNYHRGSPASDIRDRLQSSGTAAAMVREFKRLVAEEVQVRDDIGQRPDVQNVIRMLAGDVAISDELWQRTDTADTGDRVVGIALDMSGSLGSSEGDAKAAVGALALAAKSVEDPIVAVAFPQGRRESALLTGPYERWDWHHLNAADPGGGTPMRPALEDLDRLMKPLSGRGKIMFVITDGRPANPEGVADVVDALRLHGTAVVGFGFGRVAEHILADIFGQDGYRHADVEDLPRELIGAYLSQLETDAELNRA